MSAKKRALGRGLDSLLGVPSPESPSLPQDPDRLVIEIPVAEIRPNQNQPRFRFSEEPIADLARSIKEKGILQPLLVRRRDGSYELIAGERRLRAAKSIGLSEVPCLLVNADDENSFEIALIENLQREDLNALEEAKAYHALIQRFGLTQEEIAQRVGKARVTVTNSLRLLNLPLDIQEDLLEARISAGHARAILSVPEPAKQRNLRNIILSKSLSVRQAEAQARLMTREKRPRPPRPQAYEAQMRSFEEQFSMKIGLPVFIKAVSEEAGKIEIHYHSLDDFETISDFFGIEKP